MHCAYSKPRQCVAADAAASPCAVSVQYPLNSAEWLSLIPCLFVEGASDTRCENGNSSTRQSIRAARPRTRAARGTGDGQAAVFISLSFFLLFHKGAHCRGCLWTLGASCFLPCLVSGVMAVSKLLEMGHVTQYRAVLTQSDVDAIAEHDQELARVRVCGLAPHYRPSLSCHARLHTRFAV